MAQLVYDKTGRLLFTKEMAQEYTSLAPQMLPDHFAMLENILQEAGYKVKMLNTTGHTILEEGQKYVHNDACFPAILVIGQLIDAIHRGGYDPHKVALFITQTGGGCRASNYLYLLRKALARAGLDYVPVVSLNLSGMEKNPGFQLTLPILRKAVFAVIYGDLMMNVGWQVRRNGAGYHGSGLRPANGGNGGLPVPGAEDRSHSAAQPVCGAATAAVLLCVAAPWVRY